MILMTKSKQGKPKSDKTPPSKTVKEKKTAKMEKRKLRNKAK